MSRDTRVAIVILNYLNFEDTIECVESIWKNKLDVCGVVIVENGSNNDSYTKLNTIFRNDSRIHILKSKENVGFAKGNNIGIKFATKNLRADYVLVVNNDTVFIQEDYIKKMLDVHVKDVGVIGSKIILKGNVEQPESCALLDLKSCFLKFLNCISLLHGSSFDFNLIKRKRENILHGCALMFTPDYFRYYKGFYPKTFLYCEEDILHLMCRYKNLKQVYVPNAKIFHKEDQSSEMSFQNDNIIKTKHICESYKFVLWWSIKCTMKKCLVDLKV